MIIQWLGGRSNRLLMTAIAILLVSTLFLFLELDQFQKQQYWVKHTQEVLLHSEALLSLAKDAETGQRGYLLTGDPNYLQPYETAIAQLQPQLTHLRNLTQNSPQLQPRLDQFAVLLDAKLADIERNIELRRSQGLDAVIGNSQFPQGRQLMVRLRQIMQEIHAEETALLQQRSQAADWAARTLTLSLLLCNLLTFSLISLANWWLRQDRRKRAQVEVELRQAKADLENRVADRTAELRQVNTELQQSEERLQLALEGAGDGLWDWNLTTNEVYLSPAWLEMLGYTAEDLPGTVSVWERVIHPDDFAWVMQGLSAHLQNSSVPYRLDYRCCTKAGTWRWIANYGKVVVRDAQGQPLRMAGTHRDITLQKQTEASLREAERRWRSLLENVHLAVVGLDSAGTINFINPFLLKLAGYTEAEVMGKNWFATFLPPPLQEEVEQRFTELKAQEFHIYYQNAIVTKSGEERLIAWNNTLLHDSQAAVIGTMSIGEDITDRLAMEKLKNEFISVVSHELRTPLSSIRGALGLVASGVLNAKPDTAQQMLEIAALETERLVRLVNDILDLERLESGSLVLNCDWCNLPILMQQAIVTLQPLADRQQITLTWTALDTSIWADGDRLIQTLVNLLSNAIKFSAAGTHVWLAAEQCSAEPDYIRFSVTDQGRGIPADQLETIFGRFQQVDASDSRQKGGTGLGLAICRSIVEQHGGRIWAESTIGAGSVFYFTLPLRRQEYG